jgi:hypothetical protein
MAVIGAEAETKERYSRAPKDIRGKLYSTTLHNTRISARPQYHSAEYTSLLEWMEREKECHEFWGDNLPEEIIFATGSVRKAYQVAKQLNGSGLRFLSSRPTHKNKQAADLLRNDPLELQKYFNEHINNGNKQLKRKTLLGYLYGVPVFAAPQDGETASNSNPYEEAERKVKWLHKKGGYKGKNVLIISTDTVDGPDTTDTFLGKPMYYPSFPRKIDWLSPATKPEDYTILVNEFDALAEKARSHAERSGVKLSFVEAQITLAKPKKPSSSFQESELKDAQEAYLFLFKLAYYPVGATIEHFNALCVLDGRTGEILNTEGDAEKRVRLELKVSEDDFKKAQASPDTGGGGILQKCIDWSAPLPELLEMAPPELKAALEKEDENVVLWALYCTIIGMPFVSIKQVLKKAVRRRKKEESHAETA